MNLARFLARAARAEGERPALYLGARPLSSYRELAQQAAALARGLRETHGLRPGARVALVMKNCPDYVTALFGAWWAGLAVVPLNAKLHPDEFAFALADSGASLCFVTKDLAAAIPGNAEFPVIEIGGKDWQALLTQEPLSEPEAQSTDALSWLFYTSGTTGKPKGAMLSAGNLLAMTACYFMDVDSIGAGDCILHAAPLSHGSGLYMLPHVAAGAAQVIPESGGFDPLEIRDLCRTHSGLSFFAAPTMVRRLVRHPEVAGGELPGLKTITYGGGPMYVADSRQALECLGNRLVQIYGQGESPMTITALSKSRHLPGGSPDQDHRLASVGVAQSLVEVRVGDADGKALPLGETGEVMVRGPSVMLGYWQRPEATTEAIRDGWLFTGDVGALDAWGYLTLKDRSKDLIISGGSNIYPREVEECLLTHPAVAEVSVVGQPDEDWGEVVVAFVVADGADAPAAEALDRHCLDAIARFKRPKRYRFVERLPKNNYGKVMKTALRDLLKQDGDG
ncbi:MAG: AMP-binding protein [Kiloniellales bacterium]